ncbi:hypothetical protein G352_12679 [Rhodococcus ruber BKS 20-38]|uniref:Uncharacterized protein n=1 Tax=Rhodococcus ruber BKS 20-38 TaxID=1278076 RepID=M2ZAQ5_9NOCA|nr:hypothetical protein [Rhodococcus ruber]EME64437.1 hypothetical protein G352_12679 [Rhodococcus ruber BKS 20-38]
MSAEEDVVARVRGAFVGGMSGAVSVAAHALAGGSVPGQVPAVLLLAAAVTVGLLAAGTRVPIVGVLAAGQVIGHGALSLDAGHLHVPGPGMLAAHAGAILVAALLVRGAEYGCRVGLAALVRAVPVSFAPAPVAVPTWTPVAHRPRLRRGLLVAAGLGTRGPPVTV